MSDILNSLRRRGIRVVEDDPSSPRKAKLAIVGEALGAAEEHYGIPFVDYTNPKTPWAHATAGYTLNKALKKAGVRREKCYITNVVPIRPPNNDLERLKELNLQTSNFLPDLYSRLREVNPTCILALGGISLTALVVGNSFGITATRGSILPCFALPNVKVVPSFHPAFIARFDDSSKILEDRSTGVKWDYGASITALALDIKRAWDESLNSSPPLTLKDFELTIDPPQVEAIRRLDGLLQIPETAFDIETNVQTHEITRIAFTESESRAFTISMNCDPIVKQHIAKVMREHKGLIAQNGTYDITYLMPWAPISILHFDTMLAHHRLYSELPHSLMFLNSIYTRIPFGLISHDIEPRIYNPMHAISTFQIAKRLKEELEEFKQISDFYGSVMPLFHTVTRMGWRGMLMDQDGIKQLQNELGIKIQAMMNNLTELAGEEINVKSYPQVKKYLYEKLKLPVQYYRKRDPETGERRISTDKTAIENLYFRTKNKSVRLIRDIREKRTLRENFANKVIDHDGRWRTTYSVSGTDTGRLAGKKTVFGTGSSLQNIPRPPEEGEEDKESTYIRKTMRASEGKILIEADKAQAEARLVAWFAQDEAMKDIFKSGKDIHKWNASIIFKKPIGEIKPEERYFAKRIVHAFNYGLGVDHLRDMILEEFEIGMSRAEVTAIKNAYFAGCPSIPKWQEEIRQTIFKDCRLTNPFGFTRWFFGRPGEDMYRKGFAHLPQSTCVMDINTSLPRIEVRLPKGADLLLQVHDSVVLECFPNQQEECITILRDELSNRIVIHGDPLIIPIEIKRGENWGEMEKVK